MGSSDWRPDSASHPASAASESSKDGIIRGQQRVQHAPVPPPRSEPAPGPTDAACARCGAALPRTKAGTVKTGIRFCREGCRLADVRGRRAAARAELEQALHQIRQQLDQAEDALAVLGLHPTRRAKERVAGWAKTTKQKGDGSP